MSSPILDLWTDGLVMQQAGGQADRQAGRQIVPKGVRIVAGTEINIARVLGVAGYWGGAVRTEWWVCTNAAARTEHGPDVGSNLI